jgi:hypothetical protein
VTPRAKRKVCKGAGKDAAHQKRPAPHPGPRCASCHRDYRKAVAARSHATRVQSTYELFEGEYEALLAEQRGKCAICPRKPARQIRRLAVDHDHAKEKTDGTRASIRGLLCKAHNSMLARARDNPEVFLNAYNYLTGPPAQVVLQRADHGGILPVGEGDVES